MGEPRIGDASRRPRTASASSAVVCGDTVLASMRMPSPSPAVTPSGPVTTARTAASSVRDVKVASASSAAAAGELASRAPLATRSSAFCGVRFHTVTWCSPASRRSASAWPILPIPTTASRMVSSFTRLDAQSSPELCLTWNSSPISAELRGPQAWVRHRNLGSLRGGRRISDARNLAERVGEGSLELSHLDLLARQ